MSKYENIFKKSLITEQDPGSLSPADISPEDDAAAFDASMNGDVDPESFNTDPAGSPGLPERYVEKAREWVTKIEEFADWLNSHESDSLNKQLNTLDTEGSIFRGVAKHSDSIVNTSKNLKDIAESIKGVVISAPKKQREMQQQQQQQPAQNGGGSL